MRADVERYFLNPPAGSVSSKASRNSARYGLPLRSYSHKEAQKAQVLAISFVLLVLLCGDHTL